MNFQKSRTGIRAGLVAAVGGLLVALPLLDERLFPAAWLGMTLVIAVTSRVPPYSAFRLWLLCGMVTVAVTLHWIPKVAAQHLKVGHFSAFTVGLLAITWDAFRFGVFGYLVAAVKPRGGDEILVWPAAWVGLEWIWPFVFPWQIGLTQLGWLPICQIAEFTGAYGVSFLVVWGSAAAASLFPACGGDFTKNTPRVRWRHAALIALVLGAIVEWGALQIDQIEREVARLPRLRVALVQPGSLNEKTLPILRELSATVPEDTDLVIWGESSVGEFSLALSSFRFADQVQAHARYPLPDLQPCPGLGHPLLCAGTSFTPGAEGIGSSRNTAFLIDADERIIGRYHKRVLMPWGEYAVGQQWIPGVRDLLADEQSLIPGGSAAPLVLPNRARLGGLICYEDVLSNPARETVLEGADVLVTMHNLSVFSRTAAVFQHQLCARFRAIENRRWLIRSGTTGLSSVIAATGKVEREAAPDTAVTLLAAVPLSENLTLYTRWGDIFAGTCLAATLVLVVARRLCRRQSRVI